MGSISNRARRSEHEIPFDGESATTSQSHNAVERPESVSEGESCKGVRVRRRWCTRRHACPCRLQASLAQSRNAGSDKVVTSNVACREMKCLWSQRGRQKTKPRRLHMDPSCLNRLLQESCFYNITKDFHGILSKCLDWLIHAEHGRPLGFCPWSVFVTHPCLKRIGRQQKEPQVDGTNRPLTSHRSVTPSFNSQRGTPWERVITLVLTERGAFRHNGEPGGVCLRQGRLTSSLGPAQRAGIIWWPESGPGDELAGAGSKDLPRPVGTAPDARNRFNHR